MNEQNTLSLDDEVLVERLLFFCSHCLKDLPTNGGDYIECVCGELLCYGCTLCTCERKKVA
jgi:hypothetical protein